MNQDSSIDQLAEAQAERHRNTGSNQATRLIELCKGASFFHTDDDQAFATFETNGHRETWPLRSVGFRRWISRAYYRDAQRAPGSQALQDALNVLDGQARFEGRKETVFVRVASLDDAVFIDLANEKWEQIKISPGHWTIVAGGGNPKFRRPRGMCPLPYPVQPGDIGALRPFLNLSCENDWILVVGFLLGCFRGIGPFPILGLQGEQGSAKSTAARILRLIVDPNSAPLRATPRNIDDLMIAAKNGWLPVFDNLSSIPEWLSDSFCRLATGGSFSKRALYENDDEVLFHSQRPSILNGINDLFARSDLADRSISLHLLPIRGASRRTEEEMWEAFYKVRPLILGGFCDLAAEALKHLASTKLKNLPRMADFVKWVSSAHRKVPGWELHTFSNALSKNRESSHQTLLDSSPIAAQIVELARSGWEGTPAELFHYLRLRTNHRLTIDFPKNPKALSDHLRRLAPNFRATGVLVAFSRGKERKITIRKWLENCDDFDATDATNEKSKRHPDSDEGDAKRTEESEDWTYEAEHEAIVNEAPP